MQSTGLSFSTSSYDTDAMTAGCGLLQASVRNPAEGPVLELDKQGMEQVIFNVPDYLELDVGSGGSYPSGY